MLLIERAAMSVAVERERQKVDTIIAGDSITDEQYALLPNDEDIIRCHRLGGAVSSSPINDYGARNHERYSLSSKL